MTRPATAMEGIRPLAPGHISRPGRRPSCACSAAATTSAPIASCPTCAAVSRAADPAAICREVERLADGGVKEITLWAGGQPVCPGGWRQERQPGRPSGMLEEIAASSDSLCHQLPRQFRPRRSSRAMAAAAQGVPSNLARARPIGSDKILRGHEPPLHRGGIPGPHRRRRAPPCRPA